MTQSAQHVALLHSSEKDDNYKPIVNGSGWALGPNTKTQSTTPGASPDEVDLDELMAKLKAIAANARQSPPSRTGNKHLAVLTVAIVLSVTSGAVTAQYIVPGHSHAAVATNKSVANAMPRVAAPIGGW